VHPEAVFLAGYAVALTLGAIGLEWLGRRSTDPWASPTLAHYKPPAGRASSDEPDWPHSEVPAFHLGLSAVALAAAFVMTALSAVRHPRPAELITHAAVLVIVSARIRHLIIEHRILKRAALEAAAPEGFGTSRRCPTLDDDVRVAMNATAPTAGTVAVDVDVDAASTETSTCKRRTAVPR
jgi:hypothetical protein